MLKICYRSFVARSYNIRIYYKILGEFMKDIEIIEDRLVRVERILSNVVLMELAPTAWIPFDPSNLNLEGPKWEGLPGEYPLLDFIHSALEAVHRLKDKNSNN